VVAAVFVASFAIAVEDGDERDGGRAADEEVGEQVRKLEGGLVGVLFGTAPQSWLMTLMRTRPSKPEAMALNMSRMAAEPAVCCLREEVCGMPPVHGVGIAIRARRQTHRDRTILEGCGKGTKQIPCGNDKQREVRHRRVRGYGGGRGGNGQSKGISEAAGRLDGAEVRRGCAWRGRRGPSRCGRKLSAGRRACRWALRAWWRWLRAHGAACGAVRLGLRMGTASPSRESCGPLLPELRLQYRTRAGMCIPSSFSRLLTRRAISTSRRR